MNPYEKFLGVSSLRGTPDYFELLGIARDENDLEIIKEAARFQLQKLKKYKAGNDADACREIVRRVKKAHKVLTSSEVRRVYERKLDAQCLAGSQSSIPSSRPAQQHASRKPRTPAKPKPEQSFVKNPTDVPLLVIGIFAAAIAVVGVFGLCFWLFQPGSNQVAQSDISPNVDSVELRDEPKPALPTESTSKQSSVENSSTQQAPTNSPVENVGQSEVPVDSGIRESVEPTEPKIAMPVVEPTESSEPAPELVSKEVTDTQLYDFVEDDLKIVDESDRGFTRYFSLTHLANVGQTPAELSTNKIALAKLMNSLSWSPTLVTLEPVKDCPTVFRIDLRDLKWTAKTWETLLLDYPHGYVFDSPAAEKLRDETFCETPIVRGDWFVAAASRPPLYHEILEIPLTARLLEKRLQVDAQDNIRQKLVQRIGISKSTIANSNRLIEHHPSLFGTYWKTYDFIEPAIIETEDVKVQWRHRSDLFKHPLGPGSEWMQNFRHDGNQIMFSLPNGLFGFMQTDSLGMRVDKADVNLLVDKDMPDHAVVTGASCFSCHKNGLIVATDEIRNHFVREHSDYERIDDVRSLYSEDAGSLLNTENAGFLAAVSDSAIGVDPTQRVSDPIAVVTNWYFEEVSMDLAASELGIKPEQLRKALREMRFDKETPGLLKLRAQEKIDRYSFDDDYSSLVEMLSLGRESSIHTSRKAKQRLRERQQVRLESSTPRYAERLVKTDEAIDAGDDLWAAGEREKAFGKWREAVTLAPDDESKVRSLGRLANGYEETKRLEELVKTFNLILNLSEPGDGLRVAHDLFYRSILRVTLNEETMAEQAVRFRDALQTRGDVFFRWPDLEMPKSTADIIGSVFEAQFEKTPDHQPTLLVLNTFYQRFRKDPIRHREVLLRLNENSRRTGEGGSSLNESNLAATLFETGDYAEAAALYENYNHEQDEKSGMMLFKEAEAWGLAGNNEKALSVLIQAEQLLSIEDSDSVFLVKIGDAFAGMGEHAKAINVYSNLLKTKSILVNVESLQAKLKEAMSKTENKVAAKEGMNELLDPNRKFRETAEMFDNEDSTILSVRIGSYTLAAKNWVKGQRPQKALASANNAAEALRRDLGNLNIAYHSNELAQVYVALNEKQLAFDSYKNALNHAKYGSDIANYQRKLDELSQDSTVESGDDMQVLTSPEYQARVLAKRTEALKTHNDGALAENLFKAAGQWIDAGETAEVLRCGNQAIEALKRAEIPNGLENQTTSTELAKAYQRVVLHEKQLAKFLVSTESEIDELAQYQKSLDLLAVKAHKKLASLDAETKRRIDPLTKVRERAMAKTTEAKLATNQNPGQAVRLLIEASHIWNSIRETEKSLDSLEQAAVIVAKMPKDGGFVDSCKSLAGAYARDNVKSEKYFRMAFEAETDPDKKARLKRILDRY